MPTLRQVAKPQRWAITRGLAVPDWRWAWRGLHVAIPFWERGGLPFDYASRNAGTTLGGAVWVSTEEGPALSINGTGDQPTMPASAGSKAPYDELTLYARWKDNGVSPDWQSLVAKLTAGGPSWISYDFQQDGSTGKVEFQMSTTVSPNVGTISISTLPQDRFMNLFGRWRSGEKMVLTALNDDGSLWEEQDRASVTSGTILMTDNDLVLGEFGGLCSNVCVWNRRLIDSEIAAIAKDPFGLFRMWRPTSAAIIAALTAEERRSASGIWLPLIPGVTPNASKDAEWRQESAWSYSGIPAASPPGGQPTQIRTQGIPTGSGYRARPGAWN